MRSKLTFPVSYMACRAQAQGRNPQDCQLIMPVFYVDAFQQSRLRNKSVTGIYMAFANASAAEYQSAEL
jgi:hypothetical protein